MKLIKWKNVFSEIGLGSPICSISSELSKWGREWVICREWKENVCYGNNTKRCFGSSYLNKKLKSLNDRALKYHMDYIRSLDQLEGKNRSMMKEMFPNRKSEINKLFFKRGGEEEKKEENVNDEYLLNMDFSQKTEFKKEMKNFELTPFGNIRVIHNDILEEEGDCMLIPMVSNFIPLSGFGAYILHKGGKELVKEIFISIKNLIKKRIDILNEHKEEYLKDSGIDGEKKFKELLDNTKSLQIGDFILTKPHNVSTKVQLLAFLIMPYYWQGNSYISANKLRHAFSNCLKQLNELSVSSLILPNIAAGIYGYQPKDASNILIEESVESILQIYNTIPLYNLNSISFVDKDYSTCQIFCERVSEIARNYLPSEQILPAPKYWNMVNRRLLEIPSNVVYFCKRQNKISFKKYHGIIRRKYLNYYSNIRPFKWRASRVIEPYPFFVHKKDGTPSTSQMGPRPYYYKGVTHTLYPINKKALVNIRVGRGGKLQALMRVSNISAETKPRL